MQSITENLTSEVGSSLAPNNKISSASGDGIHSMAVQQQAPPISPRILSPHSVEAFSDEEMEEGEMEGGGADERDEILIGNRGDHNQIPVSNAHKNIKLIKQKEKGSSNDSIDKLFGNKNGQTQDQKESPIKTKK